MAINRIFGSLQLLKVAGVEGDSLLMELLGWVSLMRTCVV